VRDDENSKGITKGPVDDVPEIENLLGARQKQNPLGQGGLSPRGLNGQLRISRRKIPNREISQVPKPPGRKRSQETCKGA
jgi:hypothetical protein